jgi:type II secretory pathway component PulC
MNRLIVALAVLPFTPTARADDALYRCRPASANTKISVVFKPEVSIFELTTWALGFTCKNIVFGADVPKHAMKLTVIAPNDMTPKQAMQLFNHSLEAVGLVVVEKDNTIMVKLGPNLPRTCPDVADAAAREARPASATTPPRPLPPSPSSDDTADDLQAWIDVGVHKIDDTHVEITRDLVDKVLLDPMSLAKDARIVPGIKDGKPTGFKVYAIRPTSLYAKLGLRNGDTLRDINGVALDSADKALEAYTKLRDATEITLAIDRRGTPVTLTIKIVK